MSDVTSGMSAEQLAELSALADGTLPAERRAEVEARVAASPELQELLERQRRAVHAVQALAADEPSPALRAAVVAAARPARRARRPSLRVAVVGVAAAVAAVVVAVVSTGGPGAPTVADAARLADGPPTGPAPVPVGETPTRLAAAVEGVAFPDFAPLYGWRAAGIRRGRVDGRDATAVFYRKGARRLAYVIVAGRALARPAGATATVVRGVGYRTLRLEGHEAVTWPRGGHTCVLLGDASRRELVKLASWPLTLPR